MILSVLLLQVFQHTSDLNTLQTEVLSITTPQCTASLRQQPGSHTCRLLPIRLWLSSKLVEPNGTLFFQSDSHSEDFFAQRLPENFSMVMMVMVAT